MINKTQFRQLIAENLIASVRVIPVPLESTWCIDIIIRRPMEIGADIETLASKQSNDRRGISRFESIDAAADYLRSVGVETFTVDLQDALTDIDSNVLRVIETSAHLADDEPHDNDAA